MSIRGTYVIYSIERERKEEREPKGGKEGMKEEGREQERVSSFSFVVCPCMGMLVRVNSFHVCRREATVRHHRYHHSHSSYSLSASSSSSLQTLDR